MFLSFSGVDRNSRNRVLSSKLGFFNAPKTCPLAPAGRQVYRKHSNSLPKAPAGRQVYRIQHLRRLNLHPMFRQPCLSIKAYGLGNPPTPQHPMTMPCLNHSPSFNHINHSSDNFANRNSFLPITPPRATNLRIANLI